MMKRIKRSRGIKRRENGLKKRENCGKRSSNENEEETTRKKKRLIEILRDNAREKGRFKERNKDYAFEVHLERKKIKIEREYDRERKTDNEREEMQRRK